MSFNIKTIGSPAAVKAVVSADRWTPTWLQIAILEFCDAVKLGQNVLLETSGYIDTGSGTETVKLDISTVAVAPEPHPAAIVAAAATVQFGSPAANAELAGLPTDGLSPKAPVADTGAVTAPLPTNPDGTSIVPPATNVAAPSTSEPGPVTAQEAAANSEAAAEAGDAIVAEAK